MSLSSFIENMSDISLVQTEMSKEDYAMPIAQFTEGQRLPPDVGDIGDQRIRNKVMKTFKVE